ncbi:hypothetical protein [Jeotgalibacillus proteolyticus]|uniref:Uncharacterized protein n=1 Tax=Jeotgalibacillus proteolyticus TaxID=2082395 RepID=A0A2S5GG03_9BACL|nr:hypothetical protein [Jeotgalibacillus proteolyticus]PPA71926.1 hypothetical protein C4B60_00685 [Jeotgalibacillus proteolyticus]
MRTFQSVLSEAIMYDQQNITYMIVALRKQNLISMNDQYNPEIFQEVDEKIYAAEKERALFTRKSVKPYACKITENKFVFVLAHNKQDATYAAQDYSGKKVTKIFLYDLDYGLTKGETFTSFRELKKYHDHFPVVVGDYEPRMYQSALSNKKIAN